ncbi:helix-turn-helix domain-containing protein [Nocardia terpenica]|uniref:HTH cro/C1-type domain-containing protein n=1 Tax=Nocardia terpenica TaxID=455432 RepID=A0A291RC44_9NOCA|nr:helix-turn-helix transcriptional regulator [Nocardia terpenica]ATL65111.1 hypothetical protein CRH09_01570 [Nocardia terpenica]
MVFDNLSHAILLTSDRRKFCKRFEKSASAWQYRDRSMTDFSRGGRFSMTMQLTSHETLRALMRQRGYTLDALSRATGASRSFLSQLRTGDKYSCSDELAAKITEALAVPADLVFVPKERAVSEVCVCGARKRAGVVAGAR